MGSHTFVFAGLVIALRIKYKRRLSREERRRSDQTLAPSPGTNCWKGESPNQSDISNSETDLVLPEAGEAGVSKEDPTSGPVQSKPCICYENIEEELAMRYQAFSILSWIVPLYIVLVQFCGSIALGWYISACHPSIPAENHINAWWSGIFLSASAFNNSGMSLIDANMAPFQLSYFVLLAMSALILLGNTMFPILLRIIIRCLAQIIPGGSRWQGWRDGLRLLIDERSKILCPYLFTKSELFWLAGTILIFNGIDWVSLVNRFRETRMYLLMFFRDKGGFRNFCSRKPSIQELPGDSPSGRWALPSICRQKRRVLSRRHFFVEDRSSGNLRAHVSFAHS